MGEGSLGSCVSCCMYPCECGDERYPCILCLENPCVCGEDYA